MIPDAIDAGRFTGDVVPYPLPGQGRFTFLSVFDWTLHKGWDILLEAFVRAFGEDQDVRLVIKTWSGHGYKLADIQAQVDAHLQKCFGRRFPTSPISISGGKCCLWPRCPGCIRLRTAL